VSEWVRDSATNGSKARDRLPIARHRTLDMSEMSLMRMGSRNGLTK